MPNPNSLALIDFFSGHSIGIDEKRDLWALEWAWHSTDQTYAAQESQESACLYTCAAQESQESASTCAAQESQESA